jgi:hypothetical protein
MLSQELLRMIAENPRTFLRRNYRTEEQIEIKRRRLSHIWQVSVSITQAVKPVVVYTGPGDKVGESAIEMTQLRDEIQEEINALERIQRETAEAIETLVQDVNLRAVLSGYYLAHMRWEEIACSLNYAYRWTMRLHRKGLKMMQDEAQKLISPVQTAYSESSETVNEIF